MKVEHVIVNKDDCIGIIYNHEKFGRVVVFRTNDIDLEYPIEVINRAGEKEKTDILELIMSVLPK